MKQLKITDTTSYFDILEYFNKLTNYNLKQKDIDSVDWLLGKSKGKIYFKMDIIHLIKEILDIKGVYYHGECCDKNKLNIYEIKNTIDTRRFLWKTKEINIQVKKYLFTITYNKKRNNITININKKRAINLAESIAHEITTNIGADCIISI